MGVVVAGFKKKHERNLKEKNLSPDSAATNDKFEQLIFRLID